MYYEEKMIDGVLHYRTNRTDPFRPINGVRLSTKYEGLKEENKSLNKEWYIMKEALEKISKADKTTSVESLRVFANEVLNVLPSQKMEEE